MLPKYVCKHQLYLHTYYLCIYVSVLQEKRLKEKKLEVKKLAKKKRKRKIAHESPEDIEDLARDARLLKKFKRGKVNIYGNFF